MKTDAEKIKLVADFELAAFNADTNASMYKIRADRRERVKLLRELLGRKPTREEIEQSCPF